jgi:RHS repeat-associated protein
VQLEGEMTLSYDGDGDEKEAATEYTYSSAHGSLLTKTELGEVDGSTDGMYSDIDTDKRTTTYTYATSSGLVLPTTITLKNNSNTKITETQLYYDNQPLGSVTLGNLTKQTQWISGSNYAETTHAYNSYGLVASTTDPLGHVTTFTYDDFSLYPATTTNALGHQTARTYDYSSGQVLTETDPNGNTIWREYDGRDRLTSEYISDPQTGDKVQKAAIAYTDTPGSVATFRNDYLTSINLVGTHTYFDGFGRPIQTRQEAESGYIVTDTAYNARGLVAAESLPYEDTGSSRTSATTDADLLTTYSYDPLDRVQTLATTLGTTTHAYDQWTETVTDPLANDKDFTYDAFGRLIAVAEYNGASTYSTNYTWRTDDLLTSVADADFNVRSIAYDGRGLRTNLTDLHTEEDATFGSWSFAYDAAGNLATTTDPKSQVIVHTYDALNRPLTENYLGQAGTEISYGYDTCTEGIGQLCAATTTDAVTNYTYAHTGAIASETRTIDGNAYTTSYEYDRQGHQTLLTYPDDSEVRYSYNDRGLLEEVEQRESGGSFADLVSDFDYAPHGLVSYQLFGNGAATTKTYAADELYRLTSLVTTATTTFGMGGGGAEHALIEQMLSLAEPDEFALETTASTSLTTPAVAPDTIEATDPDTEPIVDPAATTTDPISEPNTDTTITEAEPAVATTTATTSAEVVTTTSEATTTDQRVGTTSTDTLTAPPITPELKPAAPGLIKTVNNAQAWRRYHQQRVAYFEQHPELPARVLEQAKYAQQKFEDKLVEKGYADTPNGEIHARRVSFFESVSSWFKSLFALILPDTAYAYYFGVEDFEDCGSIQCSFDDYNFYGSITASLDSTGKVEGTYSLKEIVSGEGGWWEEVNNLDSGEVWVQFKLWVPDPVTYGASGYFGIFSSEDASDDAVVWINVEDFGTPRLTIAGNTLGWTNTGLDLVEGAVNTVEMRIKPGSSTGDVDIWLNNSTEGSPDYNGSGSMNLGAANVEHTRFGLVHAPESGVSTTYFADVVVDSDFIGSLESGSPSPATTTFGYTAIGGSSGNTTNRAGSKFTTGSEGGTLTSISAYTKAASGSTNVIAALYSDDAGAPDELLADQSSPVSGGGTTGQWVEVPMDEYTLAPNTTYWLWFGADASHTIYWDSGSTNQYNVEGMTYPNWSDPITPGTYFARQVSIYATYETSDGGGVGTSSPIFRETIQNLTYEYDDVGNITKIVDASDLDSAATTTYGYDDLYRLTSAATSDASTTPYSRTYAYSPIGNITNKSDQGSYSYVGDQGTSYANPHAATSIAGVTHAYDQNGNLASTSAGLINTWNHNNRLIESDDGSTVVTYGYDHTGARVFKDNGTDETHYPFPHYEVSDGDIKKHVYAGDALIATIEDTGGSALTYFNHLDHLGSTNVVTDEAGYTDQLLSYYPFGDSRIDGEYGDLRQHRQHTGHYKDDETALIYRKARYYDGATGRFTSMDPHIFKKDGFDKLLNDPQLMNTYGYARNNPLIYDDPNGELANLIATAALSYATHRYSGVMQTATHNFINDRLTYATGQSRAQYNQSVVQMSDDSPAWNFAVDHPYVGGPLTGVAAGLALTPANAARVTVQYGVLAKGVSSAYTANQTASALWHTTIALSTLLEGLSSILSGLEKIDQNGANSRTVPPVMLDMALETVPGILDEASGIMAEVVGVSSDIGKNIKDRQR